MLKRPSKKEKGGEGDNLQKSRDWSKKGEKVDKERREERRGK
jgi:hypothetical protein